MTAIKIFFEVLLNLARASGYALSIYFAVEIFKHFTWWNWKSDYKRRIQYLKHLIEIEEAKKESYKIGYSAGMKSLRSEEEIQ